MAKKVLIIGAGLAQMAGIERAKEMGLFVIATDGNPDAPGLRIADIPVVLDVKDIQGTINLALEQRIDGVFCLPVEVAVRTVAAVAQRLGLPALSPQAAENATDKYLMRKLWALNDIPSPEFRLCGSLDEAEEAVREIGLPVVIKPTDNAGSRGVSKIDRFDDVPVAYDKAFGCAARGRVLVEEYMAGVEMSVEAFVYDGKTHIIAMSDKVRTEPPYLLDTTVIFPSEQPVTIQKQAKDIVTNAINALNIDMTPVHAELMVTPEGPKMVELAARGPGFKVFTDMIPWVSGVDVVKELIKLSIGEKPDLNVSCSRGSVLRFPEVPPGKVKKVEGVDEARKIKGISDIDIYVKPGDIVLPLTSGADRAGHIISMAETRKEAMEIIARVESVLRIEIDEKPSTEI
jgi:biotin carboxylase